MGFSRILRAELPSGIRATRAGLSGPGVPDQLLRLRDQFSQQHSITLPAFLDAYLLARIQQQIETAQFHVKDHDGLGVEDCMNSNAALSLLHFVANDPALFNFVQDVTGCGPIGCFTGRVYQMVPGRGHYDSWHDDVGEYRLIGMSVNLSAGTYEGGVLHLRTVGTTNSFFSIANTGAGDAVLFRIARGLQHRLTPVEGVVPKTAFAGWFRSEPQFLSLLTPASEDGPSAPQS